MNKIFKDEKIFNNFKLQYKKIFKDQNFIDITINHFNKNGSFAAFSLALLQSRVDEKKILANGRINYVEWVDMFYDLYSNSSIKQLYEQIDLNPFVPLENIIKGFDVFEPFAEKLFGYCIEQGWDLNISKNDFNEIIKSAFGYLTYNQVECKLKNKLSDIIEDPQYDQKYTIILNNTKLFAKAKSWILKCCGLKINDLIVILLGGSNHLALDK